MYFQNREIYFIDIIGEEIGCKMERRNEKEARRGKEREKVEWKESGRL